MNIISFIAETFNFVIIGVYKFLHEFFHANSTIVATFITVVGNFRDAVKEYVLPLLNFFEACYKDFILFVFEVLSIVRFILILLSNVCLKLFLSLYYCLSFLYEGGLTIYASCQNFFTSIHCCVSQLIEGSAYLLRLILNSVLLILESGPNLLIFIYEILLLCLYHLIYFVKKNFKYLIYNIHDICMKSKDAIFSIPVKAYFGILLFIIVFYQYKTIIKHVKAYFILLFLFIKYLVNQISHFFYICLKPLYNVIIFIFYKIKTTILSVNSSDNTSDEYVNNVNAAGDSRRLFSAHTNKLKTILDKYCFKSNHYVDEQIENLRKELNAEREKQLCIICYERPKCMMLYPCRHMCVCEECSSQLIAELQACPLCRRDLQSIVHVFT